MKIIAKKHTEDIDMVELHTGPFLMAVVYIDVFKGEPYQQAIYDGELVKLEMAEVEA